MYWFCYRLVLSPSGILHHTLACCFPALIFYLLTCWMMLHLPCFVAMLGAYMSCVRYFVRQVAYLHYLLSLAMPPPYSKLPVICSLLACGSWYFNCISQTVHLLNFILGQLYQMSYCPLATICSPWNTLASA